jgi:hypothetical protein
LENLIEIEDGELASEPSTNQEEIDMERLNDPRRKLVKIGPLQTTVVDEEEVLRA